MLVAKVKLYCGFRLYSSVFILQAVLLFLFGSNVFSSEIGIEDNFDNKIIVSFTNFRPYMFMDDKGNVRGEVITFTQDWFKEASINYRFSERPTARIYHQLIRGELDIYLGPLGVPTLQEHLWEIPAPDYFSICYYIWRKQETVPINDVFLMRDKDLAVIKGFTYYGIIKQLEDTDYGVRIQRASTHETGLKMLISNRVQYLLDFGLPIEVLRRERYPFVTLKRHPVKRLEVGLILSRKAIRAIELRDRLMEYSKFIENVEKPNSESDVDCIDPSRY